MVRQNEADDRTDDDYDLWADANEADRRIFGVDDEPDRDPVDAFVVEMFEQFAGGIVDVTGKTKKGVAFETTGGRVNLRDATAIAAKHGLEPYYVQFGKNEVAFVVAGAK